MRVVTGWLLWTLVLTSTAQTLVLTGCESEEQAKIADRLIEQTRRPSWQRSKWEERCRQAGFEAVGNSAVVYLIPVHYTPAYAERVIIPLIEQLLKQSPPLCRLDELTSELRQAILSLCNRPQLVHFLLHEPSAESFRAKLLTGEILIGIGDAWWFQISGTSDADPVMAVAQSRRCDVDPKQVLTRFQSVQASKPPALENEPHRLPKEQREWRFIFSHSLPLQQQVEHMRAYLEWLVALQSQVSNTMPRAYTQLWNLFYPNKTLPATGDSFSPVELQSLLGKDVRLVLPREQLQNPSSMRFVFRKWEVGLEFITQTPDGGIGRHFIPIEVLLGLRDY